MEREGGVEGTRRWDSQSSGLIDTWSKARGRGIESSIHLYIGFLSAIEIHYIYIAATFKSKQGRMWD